MEEKDLKEEIQEETQEEVTDLHGEEDTEETMDEVEENPEVTALKVQLEELNQRFLRTAADFENYKRRTIAEKEDLAKYSTVKLIGDLLPVLDNFELALKNPGESAEAKNLYTGVEMIYRQLLQVLEKEGLQKIETVGQLFDPNKHEAIMQVEDEDAAEDTVVEELRAGYQVKDKVIRAAMVKVAK